MTKKVTSQNLGDSSQVLTDRALNMAESSQIWDKSLQKVGRKLRILADRLKIVVEPEKWQTKNEKSEQYLAGHFKKRKII